MAKNKPKTFLKMDTGRRSFLKKGAVTSVPLMMTVFGRPVLAGDPCTLSGNLSGPNSGEEWDDGVCMTGLSPGAWKEKILSASKHDHKVFDWPLPNLEAVILYLPACDIYDGAVHYFDNGQPAEIPEIDIQGYDETGKYAWAYMHLFGQYFSGSSYGDTDMLTLLHIAEGSPEFHFTAALLNYYAGGYALSLDYINYLWDLYINGSPDYDVIDITDLIESTYV